MKKIFFIIILVAINLTSIDAAGADWKFCGGATLPNGEKAIVFYDSDSVEYNAAGTFKVWVKTIKQSVFNLVMDKYEKQVVEKAAQKLVAHYYPPYTSANQKISYEDSIEIITSEELANSYEIKTYALLLFEINCNEHKRRTLSGISYKKNGEIESSWAISEWKYITPESNGDTLQKIHCRE